MPHPKDAAAYQDLLEGILYPALTSPRGVRVVRLTEGEAHSLRWRLFAAIKVLRQQSMEILPPDHPRYGRSDFDNLVIRVEGTAVYIRPGTAENLAEKLNAIIEIL